MCSETKKTNNLQYLHVCAYVRTYNEILLHVCYTRVAQVSHTCRTRVIALSGTVHPGVWNY